MNIYSGYHITKPPLIGTYRKYLSISFKKNENAQLSLR